MRTCVCQRTPGLRRVMPTPDLCEDLLYIFMGSSEVKGCCTCLASHLMLPGCWHHHHFLPGCRQIMTGCARQHAVCMEYACCERRQHGALGRRAQLPIFGWVS